MSENFFCHENGDTLLTNMLVADLSVNSYGMFVFLTQPRRRTLLSLAH